MELDLKQSNHKEKSTMRDNGYVNQPDYSYDFTIQIYIKNSIKIATFTPTHFKDPR